MTTDLVPVRKGTATQISLASLQSLLDSRKVVEESHTVTSTQKSRIASAKKGFEESPLETLLRLQESARALADTFDATVTTATVPLSREQIKQVSDEYLILEQIKIMVTALEPRYRELVFAHLDETVTRVPGRPVSQTPGKIEAETTGDHYIFERRGGNRGNAVLDTDGLRAELPAEVAAQVFKTVTHAPVPAWTEEVFDQGALEELANRGLVDLDVVAKHMTAGKWNTPTFNKTLVKGE